MVLEVFLDSVEIQNRKLVTNNLKFILDAHLFFLSKIVDDCLDSYKRFLAHEETIGNRELNHNFSAYANTLQSLKDALVTSLDIQITWTDLYKNNHYCEFIKQSRNAMTHDGLPIISMWADGLFYVPMDIVRVDTKKKLETIKVPEEDILTVCLKFSCSLMKWLKELMINNEVNLLNYSLYDSLPYLQEFKPKIGMSDEVIKLLKSSIDNIDHDELKKHTLNPTKDIYEKIKEIQKKCLENLNFLSFKSPH